MRVSVSRRAAAIGGAIGLFFAAGANAALLNGDWENPLDTTNSTSTTADNWTMSDAVGATFTNPGQRAVFRNETPGGRWAFWMQSFTLRGDATQTVSSGIVPGSPHRFATNMRFENNVPVTLTGTYYSVQMQFLDGGSNPVGPTYGTFVHNTSLAGQTEQWLPVSVDGVAPPSATQVRVKIAWDGNGGSGGAISGFADTSTFEVIPEPASLGILALGGLGLVARRRGN